MDDSIPPSPGRFGALRDVIPNIDEATWQESEEDMKVLWANWLES